MTSKVIHTVLDVSSLKAEVIHRAKINLYPVFGIPVEAMHSSIDSINTLEIDEWANAFIKSGNEYFDSAIRQQSKQQAIADYEIAQQFFNLGRWPAVLTPSRENAYNNERKAFRKIQQLKGIEIEEIRTARATGYLATLNAKGDSKLPLLVSVGGLDGWKEARIKQLSPLLEHGVAILSLDMPGTGQSNVFMDEDADTVLNELIDKALANPIIDSNKVIFYGGSFGGYWTTRLAVSTRINLVGVVSQSGPLSHTFDKTQLQSVFSGKEYLYDCLPAFQALLSESKNEDEFFDKIKSQSIENSRENPLVIDCPMLIVGGVLDSLVPMSDLVSILTSDGGIREAWINPNGIHMGRERGENACWRDGEIYQKVIFPWIIEKFSMHE